MTAMQTNKLILVVDDEEAILSMMFKFLSAKGYEVKTHTDVHAALEFLGNNSVGLIIVDLKMPEMDGIEFVKIVKQMKYPAEVLVISGFATVQTAVESIKHGAYDFIEKPMNFDKLLITVQNAMQKTDLNDKIYFLENKIKNYVEFEGIIGTSESFVKTKKLAEQLSRTDVNAMICGESGTGKEVFARAIHNSGPRGDGPFVAINCGAIPENLMESELFGHEKGAFSGAVSKRIGHFENAERGTLFLDEVTELPLPLQVKLLRAVQEKEVMRVGSSNPVRVDCRIISATNRDVQKEIAEGRFREDLFYRLSVIELEIPPLRLRLDDVPFLVQHFVRKHAPGPYSIEKEVMDVLQDYAWPGNVRELENVVQRALALSTDCVITTDLLPDKLLSERSNKPRISLPVSRVFKEAQQVVEDTFEKEFFEGALRRNKGNVKQAAIETGISRQKLHSVLRKHNISSSDFRK